MKVTRFNEALAERGDARRAVMHCLSFPFAFAVSKGEACDIQAQWVLDNAAAIAAHQSSTQATDFRTDESNFTLRLRGLEAEMRNQWARIESLESDTRTDEAVTTLAREIDELDTRVSALGKNGGLRKRVQALESYKSKATETIDWLADRVQQLEDAPGPRTNQEEVSALRQRMDALTETLEKMRSLDTSDVLAALVRDVALLKDALRFLADTKATSKSDIEAMEGFIRDSFGTVPQTPEARAWVEAQFNQSQQ